ncbi:unnamed protein product [Paramecium pentaurelia]|uniref:G domain-containing protein n=1 Tax=Paramecium pentaurelia TaxID=43138 RepID=A0A8S1YAL6_9CILI|nr:unnamed protein product [Paramecium pentaurelia]
MQGIDQIDDIGEQIISEVIQRVQSNFTKFEKFMNKQKNQKVILLCGNTGAGKSSLYNWILGADFKIIEKDGVGYLQPIPTNDEMYISKMGTNSTSVTQTFIYEYIQEMDHVLVDLPGFESTINDYHKLFIDLLFHKITTTFQTKVIYVLDSPQKELQNRGKDFIQFINQQFGLDKKNIPKIVLIINKYSEDGTDNEQIQRVKEQLQERVEFQGGMLQNIFIVHKIKNFEMIKQVFSVQARQNIIQGLQKSEIINLQSKYAAKLSSGDIVNNYLLQKSTYYFKDLKEKYIQIKQLIDNNQKFSTVPNKQQESDSSSNLPQTIEGLNQLYTCMIYKKKSDISESYDFQNFKKIYHYFLPYQDNLSSYFCMNNLESGEITRFNSVLDYLQQNKNSTNSLTDINDDIVYKQVQQVNTTENQSSKWIDLVGNVAMIIVVVFKKVYWFYQVK